MPWPTAIASGGLHRAKVGLFGDPASRWPWCLQAPIPAAGSRCWVGVWIVGHPRHFQRASTLPSCCCPLVCRGQPAAPAACLVGSENFRQRPADVCKAWAIRWGWTVCQQAWNQPGLVALTRSNLRPPVRCLLLPADHADPRADRWYCASCVAAAAAGVAMVYVYGFIFTLMPC